MRGSPTAAPAGETCLNDVAKARSLLKLAYELPAVEGIHKVYITGLAVEHFDRK